MGSLKPGQSVVLNSVPPDLIKGLPRSDQNAIRAVVGRPVTFVGYSYGQAEIEFDDGTGHTHTVWVDPSVLTGDQSV